LVQQPKMMVSPDTPPESDAAAEQARSVSLHIASLVRALQVIAGDLDAFGPSIHREVKEETGISVAARTESILTALEALRSELSRRRRRYVRAQLDELGIAPGAKNLKLHIGAGPYSLDSWINIDIHPAQLALDVRWGLPFADGASDYVFLSHTLEHFYYPDEALHLLRDIRRVLAPAGVLRVIVPDIEKSLRAYVEKDSDFFASRRRTWTWWPEAATRLEDFLAYAGAGPDFGFACHKFGYDFETLRHLLQRAGFRQVERSGYMESVHAALRHDNASLVARAMYRDQHYSLFAEAIA
jgi:predicted SAM-dependent methyltransferase